MEVVSHPKNISELTKSLHCDGKSIGLVPTMGALHEGHLSLINAALEQNDVVIVSIFVNPLQFTNQVDLERYPKTLEEDKKLLKSAGVDVLYVPNVEDMYQTEPQVSISFGKLAEVMEGAYRPGHFDGVGVVVAKLFHQTSPAKAYFGLKDLQQFLLVKTMTFELSFPVEVVGVPTSRERSGLARSSRNRRLSESGLDKASSIYSGLELAKRNWEDKKSIPEIETQVKGFFGKIVGFELEYFEIADPKNLTKIIQNNNQPVAFFVAGYVEQVRLIDNLYLPGHEY